MSTVTDAQVAAHHDRIARLADRLGRRPHIERDDLVQEGRIAVWLALEDGLKPTDEESSTLLDKKIIGRMRNWIRKENMQRTGVRKPRPYEEPLPLEDADAYVASQVEV